MGKVFETPPFFLCLNLHLNVYDNFGGGVTKQNITSCNICVPGRDGLLSQHIQSLELAPHGAIQKWWYFPPLSWATTEIGEKQFVSRRRVNVVDRKQPTADCLHLSQFLYFSQWNWDGDFKSLYNNRRAQLTYFSPYFLICITTDESLGQMPGSHNKRKI